jgi:branched-chain amino acid transport system substrate-binding protein
MWYRKSSLWYKLAALCLVLALIAPVLVACGKEKEANPAPTATPLVTLVPTITPTSSPTPTPEPTSTPTATPSPTSAGPVKIGGVKAWSGPMATSGTYYADKIIALVEKQVKDMGGILGGREVNIVRYDGGSSTAGVITAAKKAILEDKVSALLWGGISSVDGQSVADVAEENQCLFVDMMPLPADLSQYNFVVRAGFKPYQMDIPGQFAAKVLKPKTAAYLGRDLAESRDWIGAWKKILEATGAKTVYEQYVAESVVDMSPYLTKIKYENPDVLLTDSAYGHYVAMAKQIPELGGLGDTKVLTIETGLFAVGKPGAEGWYIRLHWVPGLDTPGGKKFEQDFGAMFPSTTPDANFALQYEAPWIAIKAIELAGTDTDRIAIAQAARSGKISWESPAGLVTIGTDGEESKTVSFMAHVENGKLVPVFLPD